MLLKSKSSALFSIVTKSRKSMFEKSELSFVTGGLDTVAVAIYGTFGGNSEECAVDICLFLMSGHFLE